MAAREAGIGGVSYVGAPKTVRSLEQRIRNLAGGEDLALRRRISMALVVVDNLPQLPPDRVYQVWLIQAGEPNSAGTFVIDADGRARWVIHSPEPLSRYQAITITEEPVDGSLRPTTPTLLTGIF